MFQRLQKVVAPAAIAVLMALPASAFAAGSASTATTPAGTLASGASQAYTFQYPGDGSQAVIKMNYGPADPDIAAGFDFAVYGPDGTQLGQGTDNGSGPGFDLLQFSTTTQGIYTVKVFNNTPSTSVNFTLEPQGFTVSPVNAGSTTAAQPAAQAQPAGATAASTSSSAASSAATSSSSSTSSSKTLGSAAVSGSLAGNSGGSYATYTLAYAGNGQNVTINATTNPSAPQENGAAGLNVYDPSGNLVGSATSPAPGQLTFTLTSSTAGNYSVQLYNFDPSSTISYSLSAA